MSGFLLDVNVLVALLWPPHEAHSRVQHWFAQHAARGWATCAFTEAGFVRILSNPAVSQGAISPADALEVLSGSLTHPGHRFWNQDIGFVEATSYCAQRLLGHQQITDAYLLGLAIHKKGKLVTLDGGVAALAGEEVAAKSALVLL